MPTLPAELLPLIVEFAPLFSKPVWERAKTLPVGAILAGGCRTVTACLLVTGNGRDKRFQNYHRALNRARWSALRASKVSLRMLLTTFVPFHTVLCPSERYYAEKKRRHQRLTDRAWQVIQLIARWLPGRGTTRIL